MDPQTTKAAATKPANGGAATKVDGTPKKAPTHRTRSPVEVASGKVMNLIGRLPDADQRKVIQTVTALTSKGD